MPPSEFNWKIKNIALAPYCRVCSREYIRDHYKRNRQYYLNKANKRNLKIKISVNGYVWTYLSSHQCIDCGENDPLVLEFDHRDRLVKKGEISRIIRNGGTLEKVISEILKCDIRCANCHRRKTAKESNSWKLAYQRLSPNG